jgi:hypothetical protein
MILSSTTSIRRRCPGISSTAAFIVVTSFRVANLTAVKGSSVLSGPTGAPATGLQDCVWIKKRNTAVQPRSDHHSQLPSPNSLNTSIRPPNRWVNSGISQNPNTTPTSTDEQPQTGASILSMNPLATLYGSARCHTTTYVRSAGKDWLAPMRTCPVQYPVR